jgi:hypothetical protein
LNGSFVTAKEDPGDFDAVWDPEDVDDDLLDPVFGPLGMAAGRRLQKERFGGEWFPNVLERDSGLFFARRSSNETATPSIKASSCSI